MKAMNGEYDLRLSASMRKITLENTMRRISGASAVLSHVSHYIASLTKVRAFGDVIQRIGLGSFG